MRNRKLNIACLISTILTVCTLVLCLAEPVLDPWKYRISFGHDFHVSVWDCRIAFFNDAEYGPYRGSLIKIDDEPKFDREIFWGESLGIYYRYFRWQDGTTLWTLMVSLLYPFIVFMILPAVWLRRRTHS